MSTHVDGRQKVVQVNLASPARVLGSRKERKGHRDEHATYSILFESCIVNTGDFLADAKGSGK